MGAVGYGSGAFKPAIHGEFQQLIAMQDVFLSRFAIYASAEQKAFLKSTFSGAAVNEVNRMRKIAIDSPVSGTLEGVEGSYWFKTITQKINLLKEVEDKIADDLQATAASIEGAPMSEEAGGGIRSWRHQQASETKAETATFSEEATALQQTLPIREQTDRRGVVQGASVQGAHWPETLGLIIL